jgi:methylase of polypeptide subunit release factors
MTPSARVLTRFTIPRKVGAALDLCCGSGIHALQMVSQCDHIAASDLNPRALQYARFNALLNGVENIELAEGDTFAPFEGRCFDLIVSNPPFFLLPSGDFLYSSNPLELDGFAENLVRQAPRFLNEGGFFQMIFEWVEVEGQSWQQRLAAWVSESGCDVWLIKHYSQRPIDYCHARIRTLDQVSVEQDMEMVTRWTGYFSRHKIAAMHGGMIAMRKRSAQRNWVEVEDAPFHVESSFGELVEAVFQAHDLVTGADDEALLKLRPRVSPHVRLEQVSQASAEGWAATSVQLKLNQGLERVTRVDQHAAAFLAECTGELSLGELMELYLPSEGPQAEQVRAGCIAVMRQLMRRGFLLNGRA